MQYDAVLSRCEKCAYNGLNAPFYRYMNDDGSEVLSARCMKCGHDTERAFVPVNNGGVPNILVSESELKSFYESMVAGMRGTVDADSVMDEAEAFAQKYGLSKQA